MPVSCWMRLSGQPSRPSAMTCCRFSSLKTLLTSMEGNPSVVLNVLPISIGRFSAVPHWPVLGVPRGDGKTEAWAFTQIDRSVSGGISVRGRLWKRASDSIGLAGVRNYLSGDDRSFLAAGGSGFIIGDGRLNYAPESIMEAYYAWHAARDWTFTFDYQRVANPAYNQDRGPVSVGTLRVHWER